MSDCWRWAAVARHCGLRSGPRLSSTGDAGRCALRQCRRAGSGGRRCGRTILDRIRGSPAQQPGRRRTGAQQGSRRCRGEFAGGASRAALGRVRSISDGHRQRQLHAQSRCRSNSLPGVDQHDREFDTAEAGFDGLWELDLFGRVRRNVEAARADVGRERGNAAGCASQRHRRGGARLLHSARPAGSAGAHASATPTTSCSSLKLTRTRLEAGRGNELDTVARRSAVADDIGIHSDAGGVDCNHHLPIERADGPPADRAR